MLGCSVAVGSGFAVATAAVGLGDIANGVVLPAAASWVATVAATAVARVGVGVEYCAGLTSMTWSGGSFQPGSQYVFRN